MFKRRHWLSLIEKAWLERPIVWLAGVRRAGKTILCQSLPNIEYYDCEIPRIRAALSDPEAFLKQAKGRRIVLDEIHRLQNPSEILKIAADHFPDIRVLATGSSTLGASTKFKDTLAGRKRDLRLTPMTEADLLDFRNTNLEHRFLRGGLPPFFLSQPFRETDFQEWMDAYWAKDIQELFRLERHNSFQRFVELVMTQSGGVFEATKFAQPCEVSRTTIANYLNVLEATLVAWVIRPFNTHRASEIVAAPKVYGFDTGFACYFRGWQDLKKEQVGHLWEHYVLNELYAHGQGVPIFYWRDKKGHEVDFVIRRRGKNPIAIECKWSAETFDDAGLQAFHRYYPDAQSFVVAHDVKHTSTRTFGNIEVQIGNVDGLIRSVNAANT